MGYFDRLGKSASLSASLHGVCAVGLPVEVMAHTEAVVPPVFSLSLCTQQPGFFWDDHIHPCCTGSSHSGYE